MASHTYGTDHTGAGGSPENGGGRPQDDAASRQSANGRPDAVVNAWTFVEVLSRRWFWLLLSGLLLGAAGVFLGLRMWTASYAATTQLIRRESDHLTEFFKPRAFTEQTFGSLLRTPELMARVGSQAIPPLSANEVGQLLQITPVPESDIVTVTAYGDDPEFAVNLANLYATNAVAFTRELQRREAGQVNEALKEQLSHMDADITSLENQLRTAPKTPFEPNQELTKMYERLQLARTELAVLRVNYHDIHPDVQKKLAEIAELEKQVQQSMADGNTRGTRRELMPSDTLAQNGTNDGKRASRARITTDAYDSSHDFLRNQLYALAAARLTLNARQRDAETFLNSPPGYCNILTPANPQEVGVDDPKKKIAFLGFLGFALGVGAALALVMLVELLDDRLRTVDDVRRVTRLPVIATLGDLRRISESAQANWAFRTWTALQARLSLSPNHGLVCGFTSSAAGEGRSTWVHMLADAASRSGFKVLTIATLPSPESENGNGNGHSSEQRHVYEQPAPQPEVQPSPDASPLYREPKSAPVSAEGPGQSGGNGTNNMAITSSVLSSPQSVTQQLTGNSTQPLVHIPLPGWVWNLERRKQWQSALTQWSHIEQIVILVELPPACSSEAILLAENLPNLVWLADSGRSSAADSREQLQTLRNARCNLVGSVLNHEPGRPVKKRFSRWVGCWTVLALWLPTLAMAQPVQPAIPPAQSALGAPQVQPPPAVAPVIEPADGSVPVRTNVSFSVTGPSQRAAWQERLTLGPGDVLNFALFGQPDYNRSEVVVGPDGRVTYLQATDMVAAGLTVDELRARFDDALTNYFRAPRTIITPVAWRSKKYFMLGKVVNKGVYVLDRPITILEAVARAQGLETGLLDQNSIDLADLQRSFLVRGGERAPVNFEKLFYEGDLSQNIPIEPQDYLYFASGNLKEVYVVGEVNLPGPVTYTANTTVVAAIAARSGFTERAYKSHVMVVRGSINHPLTFVIDTWKTVEARGLNFRLEPKDIIYVSHRPFIRAEELLDLAITGFIQAATAAWVGDSIGPIITTPLLK